MKKQHQSKFDNAAKPPPPTSSVPCSLLDIGPSQQREAAHGFTLLELLVVLLIIGLLAAALIPGISTAIELSRSTVCKSNLRQMIIAAHAYAADREGELPPASVSRASTANPEGSMTTWEDFLWNYDTRSMRATSQKIHQCPSFRGAANWGNDRYTGYNYNASYIGGVQFFANGAMAPHSTRSANLADIKNPSNCAVFGDGQYESGANKFMRSPAKGSLDGSIDAGTRVAGTQGFRHRGATNVAFADASVRPLKDRFTTSGRNTAAKGCGFLSVDNSLYDLE